MRAFRHLALVALVLASAVVVVASPASATPALTTSTGTRPDGGAVEPFLTPIGDTLRRSITISQTFGARRGSSFSFVNLNTRITSLTCIRVTASMFPDVTHTRSRIPSLSFDGCLIDNDSTIKGEVTFTSISSSSPFFIHFTRIQDGSMEGMLEIPAGQGISFDLKSIPGGATLCEITLYPQSLRLILLTPNRTLTVRHHLVRYTLDNAPGGGQCPNPNRTGELTTDPSGVEVIRYTEDENSRFRSTRLSSQ
jgi:hypothetical protein